MLEKFVLVVVTELAETVNISIRKSHCPHTPSRLLSYEQRQ